MAIPRKRKIVFVIIALLIVIVLVVMVLYGIGLKARREEKEKLTKLAKEKAIEYIEDKYGFEAEIVYTYLNHDGRYSNTSNNKNPTGTAEIQMEHEGKNFSVKIDYKNGTGYDNYQFDEIEQAFEDRLNSEIPGGKIEDFQLTSPGYKPEIYHPADEGMVSKEAYYDGNDLTNVIENANVTITAFYTNTEFHDCSLFKDITTNNESSLSLFSFTSDEMKEKCRFTLGEYTTYAPYINDRWQVADSKSEHPEPYYLRDCGDFLVYAEDLNKDAKLNVIETDSKVMVDTFNDELKESYEKAGYSSTPPIYKPVSKGYRFETDAEGGIGKIFVFYPKKDLKIDDGYHTMSIIFGTTSFATECGDYISVDLLGDDEFCIVETPTA